MIIQLVFRYETRLNMIIKIIRHHNPHTVKNFHENNCIHTAEARKVTSYGRSFIYSFSHFYNRKNLP